MYPGPNIDGKYSEPEVWGEYMSVGYVKTQNLIQAEKQKEGGCRKSWRV